uniref:Uncharacterized protein n=1 Tax=Bionectria ochroleuca TaxID=29856 RepID=A0A8H7NIF7_BIOOC
MLPAQSRYRSRDAVRKKLEGEFDATGGCTAVATCSYLKPQATLERCDSQEATVPAREGADGVQIRSAAASYRRQRRWEDVVLEITTGSWRREAPGEREATARHAFQTAGPRENQSKTGGSNTNSNTDSPASREEGWTNVTLGLAKLAADSSGCAYMYRGSRLIHDGSQVLLAATHCPMPATGKGRGLITDPCQTSA